MVLQAIIFDLFETLVTEYDPHWKPGASPAQHLGVPGALFDAAWSAMRSRRMLGQIPDFATALRMVCDQAGVPVDEAGVGDRREPEYPNEGVAVGASVLAGLHGVADVDCQLNEPSPIFKTTPHATESCAMKSIAKASVAMSEAISKSSKQTMTKTNRTHAVFTFYLSLGESRHSLPQLHPYRKHGISFV